MLSAWSDSKIKNKKKNTKHLHTYAYPQDREQQEAIKAGLALLIFGVERCLVKLLEPPTNNLSRSRSWGACPYKIRICMHLFLQLITPWMLSLLCRVEQRCFSSTVYKIQPQHCDDHRLQLTGPWHDASAALLVLQGLPWPAHIGALHWHSHNTGHDAHSLWSRHPLQPLQATAGPDLQDGKLGDREISSRSLRIPGWIFTDLSWNVSVQIFSGEQNVQ